jgi:hypothetical protein
MTLETAGDPGRNGDFDWQTHVRELARARGGGEMTETPDELEGQDDQQQQPEPEPTPEPAEEPAEPWAKDDEGDAQPA